jgi:hypothetical protein
VKNVLCQMIAKLYVQPVIHDTKNHICPSEAL